MKSLLKELSQRIFPLPLEGKQVSVRRYVAKICKGNELSRMHMRLHGKLLSLLSSIYLLLASPPFRMPYGAIGRMIPFHTPDPPRKRRESG